MSSVFELPQKIRIPGEIILLVLAVGLLGYIILDGNESPMTHRTQEGQSIEVYEMDAIAGRFQAYHSKTEQKDANGNPVMRLDSLYVSLTDGQSVAIVRFK